MLVERALAPSRDRARALVMAGAVFVAGNRVDKPGTTIPRDAAIEVRGSDHPWVSRGGLKLAHALETFALDVTGAVALDVAEGGLGGLLGSEVGRERKRREM